MFRSRIPAIAFAAITLGVLPLVAACANQDKTVVSVNGQNITKSQLDARLEGQAGKPTLQQMVDQDIVLQYGAANHIDVTDKEIQDQLNQLMQRFPPGQFETILKNQGLTLDDAKSIEKVQLIVKKAVEKTITVTDAQIADFYNKNKATYNTPVQVKARHILVKTKAEADAVEAQLRSGANFATLATKLSTDPGSKANGGELGFFGATQMVGPFSQVAFALKVGQISQPVKTPFGWHVILVEDKKPAHTATLAEATPKIRAMLVQQQEQSATGPWIQALRQQAKIVVSDDRFNPLFPPPPGMGTMGSPTPAGSGK